MTKEIPQASYMDLWGYDVLYRELAVLLEEHLRADSHSTRLNLSSDLASLTSDYS